MSPTTLFLHTEFPTRLVLERHRPEGRLVLATDHVTPDDADFWDEVIELPPVERVADTVARLAEIPCDEVVVQTEYGLLAGSLLAKARGLRAPTPEAAHLTTNKFRCREELRAAGVAQPRFALAASTRDVRRFADGAYPIVLKPVASTLGHLVTKVASDAEVDAVVAQLLAGLPHSPSVLRCREFAALSGLDLGCDPVRQFLVEEYADGRPAETDGLVVGDAIDLFGATEQVVSAPPHFFFEGYLFPVPRPDLEVSTRAALRALGLRDAGFSIEFRGGALIEVNGRLGEDAGFPDLFHAATGRYPILKWLARDATPTTLRPGGCAVAYASCYRDAVVRRVPPDAIGATVLVAPGTRMHAPPHPDMAPHLAWALASHAEGAHAAYAVARARVDSLRFDIEEAACAS